jgi:aspartyl-tRNA(Asn)/glutamyl-tRNA(Gln) amidotransferase subunit C
MSLTYEEVEYIAMLARLELSEEEKRRYQQQLSAILEHVAHLQKLNTSDLSPTSSHLDSQARLRRDEPRKELSQERALENAPDLEDNQFKVPPVLE